MSALNSRILIVDDEAPIRALLGEHLQLVGYDVAQAANGVAALKLLAGGEFDLVLTDVRMPGMSGLELLAEIVRTRPGVGVLMLTASATIEPGPGFVLLSGDNGAGKTNLLEAVSMLTPGRGLRGAALSEMARHGGSGGWELEMEIRLYRERPSEQRPGKPLVARLWNYLEQQKEAERKQREKKRK